MRLARLAIGFVALVLSSSWLHEALATAPLAPASRILLYGDAGAGDATQYQVAAAMARRHQERQYSFAVSMGDNQYVPTYPGVMADIFEKPYRPLIHAGLLFFQTVGNHDMEENRVAEHLAYSREVAAEARGVGGWVLPGQNYVIERDNMRWVVINVSAFDGTVNFPRATRAYAADQLCKPAHWKVLSIHYPLWSTGMHGDNPHLQELLLPILRHCPVHFVFSGHDHHAEYIEPWEGTQIALFGNAHETRRLERRSTRRSLFKTFDIGFGELLLEATHATLNFLNAAGNELYQVHVPHHPKEIVP